MSFDRVKWRMCFEVLYVGKYRKHIGKKRKKMYQHSTAFQHYKPRILSDSNIVKLYFNRFKDFNFRTKYTFLYHTLPVLIINVHTHILNTNASLSVHDYTIYTIYHTFLLRCMFLTLNWIFHLHFEHVAFF